MIKIEMTEEQLDDLKSILDYVCEVESEDYLNRMDESLNTENHAYVLANNLRALTWSKV